MKSIELKISLMKKKKKIMRTLLVSKNTTYEKLHEMIQILFNLDCCETYCFEVNKKMIQIDKKHSEKKILAKNQDVFYYHYDLVEPLHFKIEVSPINETITTPRCIKAVGKHLYEGLNDQVESKYQGNVEMDWVNASLSYFNEEKQKEFFYEVKNLVKELSSIRFFQDYMHNQIVQIRLPQNKTVYMACDASEDVILNFHINANKLLEYTSINQKAIPQSIIKYHDCIELCMLKRSNVDEKTDFDFNIGNYGVFLSHANVFKDDFVPAFYMHMYVEALRKYVETIKYCQKNQIKFNEGKMLEIDEKNQIAVTNGQMVVYNISLFNQSIADKIKEFYPKNHSKVEIDVLTLTQNDQLKTICIVGDSVNGHLECEIFNGSMKTMLAKLFMLLQERWSQTGIDAIFVLRDKNLEREFHYLAELLGVECRLENKLPSIDAKYISTIKRTQVENMDPKTLILRLLEELGIDANSIQSVDATNEILEKIGKMKDEKKYN